MSKKLVAVNEQGRRIGESHPRAKLTDHEVDLVHELVEEGMSLRQIAQKLECHFTHVGRIARSERRAHTIAGVRSLEDDGAAYDPQHDPETGSVRPRVPQRPQRD